MVHSRRRLATIGRRNRGSALHDLLTIGWSEQKRKTHGNQTIGRGDIPDPFKPKPKPVDPVKPPDQPVKPPDQPVKPPDQPVKPPDQPVKPPVTPPTPDRPKDAPEISAGEIVGIASSSLVFISTLLANGQRIQAAIMEAATNAKQIWDGLGNASELLPRVSQAFKEYIDQKMYESGKSVGQYVGEIIGPHITVSNVVDVVTSEPPQVVKGLAEGVVNGICLTNESFNMVVTSVTGVDHVSGQEVGIIGRIKEAGAAVIQTSQSLIQKLWSEQVPAESALAQLSESSGSDDFVDAEDEKTAEMRKAFEKVKDEITSKLGLPEGFMKEIKFEPSKLKFNNYDSEHWVDMPLDGIVGNQRIEFDIRFKFDENAGVKEISFPTIDVPPIEI